jgi:hypothetical protein
MPNSPIYAFPYPALSDPPNGPLQIGNLANAVDAALNTEAIARAAIQTNLTAEQARHIVLVKGTDKTVNNTAVYSPDGQLTTGTLPANTNWTFDAFMVYSAATPNVGMKFGFSGPAGFVCRMSGPSLLWTVAPVSGAGSAEMQERDGTTAGGQPASGNGVGNRMSAVIRGFIGISSTPGAVAMNIAQVTANASNAVLYTFSWLRLDRAN